jgi:hypothetical protein
VRKVAAGTGQKWEVDLRMDFFRRDWTEGRSWDWSEMGGWSQNGFVLEGPCRGSQQGPVSTGEGWSQI